METDSAIAVTLAMSIPAIAAKLGFRKILLRKRNRLQIKRAGLAGQDHRIGIVQLGQLLNVLEIAQLVKRDAGHVGDGWRIDRLVAFQVIGLQLQQPQGTVRNQNVVVAILLVRNHIERLVARSQVRDGHALYLGAGLQVADRDLDEWRAGVSSQYVLLAVNRIGDEGSHRRLRFILTVRRMPDLERSAFLRGLEGERNGAQRG